MQLSGIRLGRIFGIQVSADLGVLVIGGLLAWLLATSILPAGEFGLSAATYWSLGLLGALLFLISLLAHELSHSVVARRDGIEVVGITLWMFGGVAEFKSEARTAWSELRIAAAGPAMSLLLGGAFIGTAIGLDAAGVAGVYPVMLYWLGWINLFLGVFNLLPGAPLDGGRVLSAILWQIRGDRLTAKVNAARCGRVVGILVIAAGCYEMFVTGDFSALWTVLVGWFLFGAARSEEAHYEGQRALGEVAVAAAMTQHPQTANAWSTVRELVDGPLRVSAQTAVPVLDVSGRLLGLATMSAVQKVPAEAWTATQVGTIAIPSQFVPVVAPTDRLTNVLDLLRPESGGFAVVIDDGRVVGMLSPADIQRALVRGRGLTNRRGAAHTEASTPHPVSRAMAPVGPPPSPNGVVAQRWHAPVPPGGAPGRD